MKFLIGLLFVVILLLDHTYSIMYGKFISIKEAPYFVSLYYPSYAWNRYLCGGAIISDYWIISAAHCAFLEHNHRVLSGIITGTSLRHTGNISSSYEIEKVFVYGDHADTDDMNMNDIVLIKLKRPIEFNEFSQPIKISKIVPRENDTITIIGLGFQGDTKGVAQVLRQSEVTIVNRKACNELGESFNYRKDIFCAGNGTTDVCQGDSGGPVVIDKQLVGLVSYGPDCHNYKDHNHQPGAYTRLDIFYDWIVRITGIEY